MKLSAETAISEFGAKARLKLANTAVSGQPEDQLRSPFEGLLADMAEVCGVSRAHVAAVGESSVSDLKTRPDFAVTVRSALVGFVELKSPGKGADPRKFRDAHDKEQWERLRALPNLIYTDGNEFSLWQNGEIVGAVERLIGDIETSGSKLGAPPKLPFLFENFFRWQPISPRSAKDLAHTTARLCRLLRDEVTEQLGLKSEALTALATDWRKLLFPDATDERFADGYAQAVTFGMLMARAKKIQLSAGLHRVAEELSQSSSLIGAALRLLTDNTENQATLKTSLGTLMRVLDVVDWSKISKDRADAWLYFYEDFLEVYDNQLRKQTGSYYTPPEVVSAMVNMVDEALKTSRYGLHAGLASPSVTLADPAVGTGTFLLGVMRRIAETVKRDEGEGAVQAAIHAAVTRLIAFEMQLGPFAVAQLRILAEIVDLAGSAPTAPVRMFVTNTLGNPDDDEGWIPGILAPIARSRRDANRIKREEPITVVIGNPPYKEKAKGRGGWVEGENPEAAKSAPFADWIPPADWGVGAHAKHLRNLYVYFWRWATWKVYDHRPNHNSGIVCFITVAGFLNGPGFQRMRDYLRRKCDDIWVIDCSPEGHQPDVNTRIFQGVQQPVCIVLASRSLRNSSDGPANVLFQALPLGRREAKFKALSSIRLKSSVWLPCPSDWRAPFLPAGSGPWATYPAIEDLFIYNGSGVMPGRTWIIAPDADSLNQRWRKLIASPPGREKEALFHPHLNGEDLGDRHTKRIVKESLPGFALTTKSVDDERGPCVTPIPYAFRSFDRQWIIPDNRLINRPNPELWESLSERQVYITAPSDRSPTNGPALTVSSSIPDLHHYNGRGGRTFPLWRDAKGLESNVRPNLVRFLARRYRTTVTGEDIFCYVVGVVSNPAFTAQFRQSLSTPGLHVPITADAKLFAKGVEIGRTVIWLQTFGERMADEEAARPEGPPRLPADRVPRIPKLGAISESSDDIPDSIDYDPAKRRLIVGGATSKTLAPRYGATRYLENRSSLSGLAIEREIVTAP